MTGPGISAMVPAGRSFHKWMPNAASTLGASSTPSRIIASAPCEISSAGWNASFTLPGRNAACSRRATSRPQPGGVDGGPAGLRRAGRGGGGGGGVARSYAGTRAQSVDDALLALRSPRDAHAPSMQDQRVRERRPLVARHERHQVALDLHRVLLFRQTEQRRESLHVRVDHDAFILPEPRAEYDVRGLAAYPGELDQLLHRVGYRTSVTLDQRLRHPDDGFGLVAEEPGAVDFLFQEIGRAHV